MVDINPDLLKRFENESDEELIYRLCSSKDQVGSWQDVSDILNKLLNTEYTESKFRKQFQSFQKMLTANESKFISEDNYLKEIQIQKRELERERMKLQTEKLEYNRWLREHARDELIAEKIVEAIASLPPLDIPNVIPVKYNKREGCLIYGDEHYGAEFEIHGLFGEILNAYSPEIFEERMWNLFNQTIEIIRKECFTKINLFSMGDFIDGMLRVGQLFKLRYGVVEGTVKYADFICNWLNELTKYVNVEFQMVHGNHSELRMLGQPKGTFKDDNMGMIVYEMIKTRLGNNPNFTLVKNPTGLIFTNICGYNVLGIHGEVKNMESALKDFSNTYKVELDFLLAGHLHHTKSETIGVNRDVINVPSIIGVDPYAMSINKTSNSGATFIILEEGKGKVQEYNIKLN